MDKLHETLLILNHFNGVINGRTNYCKRNVNFNSEKCISDKMNEKKSELTELNEKSNNILAKILRECADCKVTIHSYICLNIIDMFSFNDEYIKFFNPKNFVDEIIKKRILTILEINSKIKKKIDWQQLQRFRNNVLAHNLRDDKNNQKLSLNTFKELSQKISSTKLSIEYFDVVLEMFKNIETEFQFELIQAKEELKNVMNK